MKYLKKKGPMAIWKLVLLDALLVGMILLVFAFFHHAMPWLQANFLESQAQLEETEPSRWETAPGTESTASTSGQEETETQESEPVDETETTEETTEPDNRTEWQIKFEDRFTDEVVTTENSYTSPEVSITIDTVVTQLNGRQVTYYVADIYVASLDNFRTYPAYGEYRYYGMQDGDKMVAAANAIIAISGDYMTNQKNGFIVRNGEVYLDTRSNGVCVLYGDGTMETLEQGTYEVADVLAREPLQVWSFGPSLLDADGKALDSFTVSSGISGTHPRCAIGYYEPGHYCFVVVDGRQNHSYGMKLTELAQVFEDLGCQVAYNLDGGATAVMYFNGEQFSSPSNGGRELGDILLITESGYGNAEEGGQ